MPPKASKGSEEDVPLADEISWERTEQEEQCERIFKDLAKQFKKLQKVSNPDKIHAMIKDITAKLKEAKALIKDFEREARADGMPPNELNVRRKELAAQLNAFIEMKKSFAANEGSKADLLNGAAAGGGEVEMEAMSMQQLMTKGRKDIQDIDKTLDRTLRIAEDTKDVGKNVAAAIHDQTEKLEGIMDQLNEIEFTMKKASKVIRDITRGLLTDKCIAFLLLLVVCGVVAIIVIKVIDPKKAKQGADAIVANVTTAINNTDIGAQVISNTQDALNKTANAVSRRLLAHLLGGRRMLGPQQDITPHVLDFSKLGS